MDTDGESRDIGNEKNPAIATWTVCLILPFQDEPEHQRREERGEGIDLSLNSREPESVAEGIGQSAYQSAGLNGDNIGNAVGINGWTNQFLG